jgi:hypothetical protein
MERFCLEKVAPIHLLLRHAANSTHGAGPRNTSDAGNIDADAQHLQVMWYDDIYKVRFESQHADGAKL